MIIKYVNEDDGEDPSVDLDHDYNDDDDETQPIFDQSLFSLSIDRLIKNFCFIVLSWSLGNEVMNIILFIFFCNYAHDDDDNDLLNR